MFPVCVEPEQLVGCWIQTFNVLYNVWCCVFTWCAQRIICALLCIYYSSRAQCNTMNLYFAWLVCVKRDKRAQKRSRPMPPPPRVSFAAAIDIFLAPHTTQKKDRWDIWRMYTWTHALRAFCTRALWESSVVNVTRSINVIYYFHKILDT